MPSRFVFIHLLVLLVLLPASTDVFARTGIPDEPVQQTERSRVSWYIIVSGHIVSGQPHVVGQAEQLAAIY